MQKTEYYIQPSELVFSFIRSSGPGGQNVNKVASAVQLRFNVKASQSLPESVKERLVHLAGHRVNDEGVLIIDARRFRSQLQNRRDALDRLEHLVHLASQKPKHRKMRTTLSRKAKAKRLEKKRYQSEKKQRREKIKSIDY